MNIQDATHRYEAWVSRHTLPVKGDLALKHSRMKADVFSFLRATFYRWIQVSSHVCRDLQSAPEVLSVGDLHLENFGTWYDLEGRINWGINDFDEASPLPYTNDLVRLAVSAKFAIETGHLRLRPRDACEAILAGYSEGLESGGRPIVLAERNQWLRDIAISKQRTTVRFWQKMRALPPVKSTVPGDALRALEQAMPERPLPYQLRRRTSGLGSLGRPRFVAIAEWHGDKIVREAKSLVPSACAWAQHGAASAHILYRAVLNSAIRCRDPFVRVRGQWLVRRLSPYCSRIELSSLAKKRDEFRLLHAMGWETANVHLGSKEAIRAVRRDLATRPPGWLRASVKSMAKATLKDWKDWR